MASFEPNDLKAISKQLHQAEEAARQIYIWIDEHVVADDVRPRELGEPLRGYFNQLIGEILEAKSAVSDLAAFAEGAALKVLRGEQVTPRERHYVAYLAAE